jgi:hypothetical protein
MGKEKMMNIAPEGTWRCFARGCGRSWTGKVDQTPDRWKWVEQFTADRLLRRGKIEVKSSYAPACLCPEHQSLVTTPGGLLDQGKPSLFLECWRRRLR